MLLNNACMMNHLGICYLLRNKHWFFFMHLFKSQEHEHRREDTPDLWSEITGRHTNSWHITDTKPINTHLLRDHLLWNLFDRFGLQSRHYPRGWCLFVTRQFVSFCRTRTNFSESPWIKTNPLFVCFSSDNISSKSSLVVLEYKANPGKPR